MKSKKTVGEKMEQVYYIWDNISVAKARDELKKMYLSDFNITDSVKEKRLILYNLTCAEFQAYGKTESAKLYARTLLDFLNNVPNYKETNREEYAKAITNVLDSDKENFSKEELIEMYEFCYETYKHYTYDSYVDGYLNKLIAKFNLHMTKGNFNIVSDVVRDMLLHNDNADCATMLEYAIKEIKAKNKILYNQILSLINSMQIDKIG